MPLEHEYKWIVKNIEAEKLSNYLIDDCYGIPYAYEQAYLPGEGRVRQIRNILNSQIPAKHKFTYKLKIPTGIMEWEIEISEKDYEESRPKFETILYKNRIKIIEDNIEWEIDFLKKIVDNTIYAIIIEVEMPAGTSRPELPEFLKYQPVYEVELYDKRFTNKALSDIKKTEKLLKSLTYNVR